MEEKAEKDLFIWIWIIVVAIAVILVVSFIVFLK
jgi:hypothetical protein